jgi:cathepsin A (carboxypeptidase C)
MGWEMCASVPHLMLSFDQNKMAGHKMAQLLDNDIPILIYNGDKDYICNWMGGLAWTEALEWTGYEGYNEAPVELWTTASKKKGGQSKSFGSLTFLRVFNAGHMVPMDQPEVALEMLSEFIKSKTINSKTNH